MSSTTDSKTLRQQVAELLLQTSVAAQKLDQEANEHLARTERDTYGKTLIKKGSLIADLLTQFDELIGDTDDEKLLGLRLDLIYLERKAKDCIETKNSFGLGTLLTFQGDRVGDPDLLQARAQQLSEL